METETHGEHAKFIRNTWYVAAEPDEVTSEKPLARTILNERVVLYRNKNKQVVAFRDVCPHRFAPLSSGKILGDDIQCPYHGAVYDQQGKCVSVPGLDKNEACQSDISLRRFPTIERYNYIWIWMGDPELSKDESSIPEWFSPADPDNEAWNGRHDHFLSMPIYYELINDNLHDVSHVEFVHPETLGASLMPEMLRMPKEKYDESNYMTKKVDERSIHLEFHRDDVQAGPMFHNMLAYHLGCEKEGYTNNVDWYLTVRYATPSYFLFNPRTKERGAPESQAIEFASLNAITPETDTSCHYFFYTANNLSSTPERQAEFAQLCADGIVFAFKQDEALIREQMLRVPDCGRLPESLAEICFTGDSIQLMGRKIVRRQIEKEESRIQAEDRAGSAAPNA